jgi:catechol 2,3-dioxygenase-like lactoylglutathione lyase family enzyme
VTTAAETARTSHHERCGCCGRQLPKSEVVELGTTPGVFICVGCAYWAARRAGPVAALRQLRFTPLGSLVRRLTGNRTTPGSARAAIPILPSADMDRTAAFYTAAGFSETERHDGYLLLHNSGVELHFTRETNPVPGQCFVHVADAVKLWKQLRDRGITGVGEIAEQDYGLREFVLTDPDGNRIRIGSPTS